MGKGLKFFIQLPLWALLVASCRPEMEQADFSRYTAHLQLDSTELLLSVVEDSLLIPRKIEWDRKEHLWYAQQNGLIGRIHLDSGRKDSIWKVPDIYHRKSTGVFSMVLHPDFQDRPYIYLHYTYGQKDSMLLDRVASRVIRLTWDNKGLGDMQILIDSIPGNTYHNGSSMIIAADGKLWVGLGDAGATGQTQDPSSLAGKVLRLNLDGSIPEDNPYKGSPVWSRGHRNIQGLTQGNSIVYASEHGPNDEDEVNRIEKGANYGWPDVHGYCDLENEKAYCLDSLVHEPLASWTPTIAPAALLYYANEAIPEWKNSLLLANLKGRALRVLKLDEDGPKISGEHIYLQKELGRIRDIAMGPEGSIFLATSNLDWHPVHQPWMYDSLPTSAGDKIYKLQPLRARDRDLWAGVPNPRLLKENPEPMALESENFAFAASEEEQAAGQKGYLQHCAACHGPDGAGNPGYMPPLVNSEWVQGSTARLIDITLGGLNTPIEVNGITYEGEMPAYSTLSDEEIRDILNFIRIEFGGMAGNIIAADVMHQRKGL